MLVQFDMRMIHTTYWDTPIFYVQGVFYEGFKIRWHHDNNVRIFFRFFFLFSIFVLFINFFITMLGTYVRVDGL